MEILQRDAGYILDFCTKYLARGNRYPDSPSPATAPSLTTPCEAWRFPIVNSYGGDPGTGADAENEVIFVYAALDRPEVKNVSIIGTFASLNEPISLQPVLWQGEPTGYFALAVALPVERSYRYRFMVDGV